MEDATKNFIQSEGEIFFSDSRVGGRRTCVFASMAGAEVHFVPDNDMRMRDQRVVRFTGEGIGNPPLDVTVAEDLAYRIKEAVETADGAPCRASCTMTRAKFSSFVLSIFLTVGAGALMLFQYKMESRTALWIAVPFGFAALSLASTLYNYFRFGVYREIENALWRDDTSQAGQLLALLSAQQLRSPRYRALAIKFAMLQHRLTDSAKLFGDTPPKRLKPFGVQATPEALRELDRQMRAENTLVQWETSTPQAADTAR